MKNILILVAWGLSVSVWSQTQLDVQGKPGSLDTVVKVKVNYTGLEQVVGLRVHSAPNGASGLYGIGGDFFGGNRGIQATGNSTGVIGFSPSTGIQGIQVGGDPFFLIHQPSGVLGSSSENIGVWGASLHHVGVVGNSTDSVGVYGSSLMDDGVMGVSTFGAGLHGKATNGLAIFGESNSIAISGISYGSVPILALFGNYGVVGSSADGGGVYGFSMLEDGVIGETNDPQNDYDFWAINGRYGGPSSIRWKENIANIPEPLEKLSHINGVYFDWDDEHGGYHSIGFIAEEVGAVLPEIVSYEENGIDARGMDYSKMTPLILEAVKAIRNEYQEKLAAQQKQIDQIMDEIQLLRQLIN